MTCSGCGLPRYETMAPDGPDFNAFPVRCRGCEAKEAGYRAMAGIEEPDPMIGIKMRIERA